MTARLSDSIAELRPARVVSVSPLTADCVDDAAAQTSPTICPQCEGHESAEREDDALARSLPRLIAEAQAVIAALGKASAEATSDGERSRSAVRELQDRLRLSARMLQALTTQITRTEAAIAELDDKQAESAAAVRQAQAHLDELTVNARSDLQQRLAEDSDRLDIIQARLGALDDRAAGIASHMQAVTSLEQLLERLEPWERWLNVQGSADQSDCNAAASDLPEPLRQLVGDIRTCLMRDAGGLAETLRAVADRFDALAGTDGDGGV